MLGTTAEISTNVMDPAEPQSADSTESLEAGNATADDATPDQDTVQETSE